MHIWCLRSFPGVEFRKEIKMCVFIRLALLVCLAASVVARAQTPLPPEDISRISRFFDAPKSKSLSCSIIRQHQYLDFAFRYDTGFLVTLHPRDFSPNSHLTTYLRVTPTTGSPVFLQRIFNIPPIPPEMLKGLTPQILRKMDLELSGGFAAGEGRYKVEVMLLDEHEHTCREHWNLQIPRLKQHSIPTALEPNTVVPLETNSWDGKLDANGIRLTVLLHAAPIDSESAKLYALDREFLLQSLSSLLKQVPCRSVEVIAFNLEQQKEFFRQEHFDGIEFSRLDDALQKLELATVPYQALTRDAWAKWLVQLAHEQTSMTSPSDAVVFLGPNARYWKKIPGELRENPAGPPQFFYFEYFPTVMNDLEDSIDSLTRNMRGTVYKIHSADELGESIRKMMSKLKQPPSRAAIEHNASTPAN